MTKVYFIVLSVYLIFAFFFILKSYKNRKELEAALSKRNDLLKVKESILDFENNDHALQDRRSYCVVCGKYYPNPKLDSDTCYDCREPYVK